MPMFPFSLPWDGMEKGLGELRHFLCLALNPDFSLYSLEGEGINGLSHAFSAVN